MAASTTLAAESWRSYADPAAGYSIEAPAGFLARRDDASGHLLLKSGATSIEVYGGLNARRLTAKQLARQLQEAGGIADITYRAGGRTWLVLSGHYRREAGDPEPLIYYAKFLFSPDMSRLSGFEMSYPVSQKARMDDVVAHIQKTFRGPR